MFQRLTLIPILLILIAICVGALSLTAIWRDWDGRAFDILSTYDPPLPDEPGVTIIAIDEPSMNAIGEQWPWPRSRHAELVTALRQAGAKAIAFDVIFAEPTVAEEDQALIDAMGPDVILAADESQVERPYGSTLILTEPMLELLDAGAKTGVASLSLDGDGVLRNIARYEDGFMAVLLNSVDGDANIKKNGGRHIQYFGGPGRYPTVSYYQALDPDNYLPRDYFRDQIVLVGFALQASADVGSSATDSFETPFTLKTRQLTPGVEVQATIFDNLRTELAIAPSPKWLGLLLIILGAAMALLVSQPKAPWKKLALWVATIAFIVVASWLMLRFGRVWIAPVGPTFAVTGGVIAIAARDFAIEQRQRREIQNAFGQYLAPEMVKKIADDPTLLNLGGEKREMTILFSDIRGFTSISEAMKDDPQGLTRMINAILTPLSNIIIKHGGTIDKYMGDCVMAFWNAPLDDPDHAQHALQAAQEMLQAMEQINKDIRALLPEGADIPQIKMGIGINTGTCVVGNMGSDQRFDYSVLGDTVNIASRLEGQCKEYQQDILIGENTARSVDSMDFQKVADIRVKGRSAMEQVFTFDQTSIS
jgi:adenylate cyclase